VSTVTLDTEEAPYNEKEARDRASKNILWLGIISIVMMFGGLTSAYIVSKADNFWVKINMPTAFWVSTAIILLSSVTINMALSAAKKNNYSGVKLFTILTFALGIGFGVSQWMGWGQLVDNGSYFVGNIINSDKEFVLEGEYGKDFTIFYKGQELAYDEGNFKLENGKTLSASQSAKLLESRNTASSYLYLLTFLHVVHLLGGLLYLLGLLFGAFKRKFNEHNHLKIKLCSTYWHFLGGLWIYLFLFLLFIH
jgi:cytochrome c oxidase subunit 3